MSPEGAIVTLRRAVRMRWPGAGKTRWRESTVARTMRIS